RATPRHRRAGAGDRPLAGAAALPRRLAPLALAGAVRRKDAGPLRRARLRLDGAGRSQALAGRRARPPPAAARLPPPRARRGGRSRLNRGESGNQPEAEMGVGGAAFWRSAAALTRSLSSLPT